MNLFPNLTRVAPAFPGFEHIQRTAGRNGFPARARILPGELYVSGQDEEIVTVLGSCISVCLRDPQAGVGGMNHFLLPEPGRDGHNSARYGCRAMEQLIEALMKWGATRSRLEAKVTGGGDMGIEGCQVARRNIEFIDEFFCLQGIEPLARDVGTGHPRKVRYHPVTGRLMVCRLPFLMETPGVSEVEVRLEQYWHNSGKTVSPQWRGQSVNLEQSIRLGARR